MKGSNRAAALALAATMITGATAPGLSAEYPGAGAPAAQAGEAPMTGVGAPARAGEAPAAQAGVPAEQPPAGGESARLEPVVITATRVEQPVSQVGSAVTVITGEELRRRGIEFVADALQEVPGLTVPRAGTRGKATSLFLRGANSNQTLVLIDGVRVNDPVNGGFDFGALGTDNIERIEVIRGPQSPLYGSDAIGGVVNIITRRGRGPVSATVTGLAGNYHTFDVGGSVRGGTEQIGGTLDASRFKTDNRFVNDSLKVDTVSARIDARPADRFLVTATLRHVDAEGGTPGQAFIALAPADRQDTLLNALAVTAELRTTSIWTQRLSLGRTDQSLNATLPSIPLVSRADSVRHSIEWVHTLTPIRALSLVAGGEYRVEDGHSEDNSGNVIDADLVTRAFFAQAQLAPFGERLFLQGGARLDDGTRIDTEVTPKVAAALLVPETGTRLHASWGKGIKAPTIVDLFFPGFGNPDLDPERVTGWDAGVDQRFWGDRVQVGVLFFRNDFRDLIVFSPTLSIPVNVGRAHSDGIESSVTVRPAVWMDVAAAYTYLVAINDDARTLLLKRPRHQGSAQVTVRPIGPASVTVSGLYVGDRLDNPFAFPAVPSSQQGEYFRLDASATYRLPRLPGFRSLELLGRVENILDRKYEEVAGFPALGTNFLAGVRGTF
jgi:vitamin B12 transporter